jgi:hypothetical protein
MGKRGICLVLCLSSLLLARPAYPQDKVALPGLTKDRLQALFKDAAAHSKGTSFVPGASVDSRGARPGKSIEALSQRFFTGQNARDELGFSVATAGDMDGDGYSDVIVERTRMMRAEQMPAVHISFLAARRWITCPIMRLRHR